MKIIQTKRHIIKFYATVVFGFSALLVSGLFLISCGLDDKVTKISKPVMILFGGLVSIAGFSMVYTYFKNSPKVTIDENIIKIAKESFDLNGIKKVSLSGKIPFRFIINFPMEATKIEFSNGITKVLFDDMYSNSYEVKSFLEQVIVKKQEFKITPLIKVNVAELRLEDSEVFKGNQFTSFRGLSLWGLLVTFSFLIISEESSINALALLFFTVFAVVWFLIHVRFMHYFELTECFLVIRNHIVEQRKTVYHLSNVKEIVFETQGRQPNCMRIITTDFRSALYPAATLKDSNWLKMKKQLELKGVSVRNECIYE
jgi:hypothetical protein